MFNAPSSAPLNAMAPDSSVQSDGTSPLSCPRCETRTVDWCCWELRDLKMRVARGETLRQLLSAFPGKTEGAIREACRRYGLGKPRPGIRTRRVRCQLCRTPFAPRKAGESVCDTCDPAPAVVVHEARAA